MDLSPATSRARRAPDRPRHLAGGPRSDAGVAHIEHWERRMTKLHLLHTSQRQSPWLDNLTRAHLRTGRLTKLVAEGVRGITSNPPSSPRRSRAPTTTTIRSARSSQTEQLQRTSTGRSSSQMSRMPSRSFTLSTPRATAMTASSPSRSPRTLRTTRRRSIGAGAGVARADFQAEPDGEDPRNT